MHLMWCIIGLLAFVTKTYGDDCPLDVVNRVKTVHWARCNAENDRKVQEVAAKQLERSEHIFQACCVLSDTITCWADSLRSECGSEAANELIRTSTFKGDCSSWTYPESISKCHLWYTSWWFITIVAILVIAVVASLVFWGVKHARGLRK